MKVTYKELPGKAEAGYGITRWPSAKKLTKVLNNLRTKIFIPFRKKHTKASAKIITT